MGKMERMEHVITLFRQQMELLPIQHPQMEFHLTERRLVLHHQMVLRQMELQQIVHLIQIHQEIILLLEAQLLEEQFHQQFQ